MSLAFAFLSPLSPPLLCLRRGVLPFSASETNFDCASETELALKASPRLKILQGLLRMELTNLRTSCLVAVAPLPHGTTGSKTINFERIDSERTVNVPELFQLLPRSSA